MITIKLEKDEVTPHLRRLLKEAETNSPLSRVLGRAASNELKKHFRERNKTGNKKGWKRSNFWTAVGASVQSPVSSPGKIVIPITDVRLPLKVFGGTVRPTKGSKNLAIPIHPSVAGVLARQIFDTLGFAMTRAGVQLLIRKTDGTPLYVLKKSTTHKPDPNALPKDAKVADAMTKAGDIYLRNRR